MSVFAPTLGALWRQLEGYGIDPEPLFREQGVNPDILFDQGARLPLEKVRELSKMAEGLANDPFFGLKAADYFRPAHLGALGFAWLASSDLRTAFHRLHRYARVIQDRLSISIEEDAEVFTVTIDAGVEAYDRGIREDSQLGIVMKICRLIAGPDLNPARVQFQKPEPQDAGRHYQVFRCPLEFNCQATALSFNISDVEKKLTGSNDELAQLNEHVVVRYLAHSEKADIVNRVKAAIIDGLSNGAVTEVMVAEELHMTPRNLHRKLHKEDTSFKQLLTDVRKDLAQQYIKDRSKTLTEISFLLGFSEVSSFSRAYKGWTGKPPSEERVDSDQ